MTLFYVPTCPPHPLPYQNRSGEQPSGDRHRPRLARARRRNDDRRGPSLAGQSGERLRLRPLLDLLDLGPHDELVRLLPGLRLGHGLAAHRAGDRAAGSGLLGKDHRHVVGITGQDHGLRVVIVIGRDPAPGMAVTAVRTKGDVFIDLDRWNRGDLDLLEPLQVLEESIVDLGLPFQVELLEPFGQPAWKSFYCQ